LFVITGGFNYSFINRNYHYIGIKKGRFRFGKQPLVT
jgi:hypothetical protein